MQKFLTAVALAISLAFVPALLRAADGERKLGWAGSAELSYVSTGGNAVLQTLGFKGALTHLWESSGITFDVGGVRADSETTVRRALLLSNGAILLREDTTSETTAEAYFLRGRYDRELASGWSAYGGAGWERNRLAGIDSRIVGVAGVSRTWFATDRAHFRTDAGATWTREEQVAGDDQSFAGLRLGWDYGRLLTPSTTFSSALLVDENLDDTDDLRVDTTQSLAVAMTDRMALKVSLQVLYDAQPAFVGVPVEDELEIPTGEIYPVELESTDWVSTVALVVTF